MAELSIIYAREELPERSEASIFLMGPTPRSSEVASWRPDAIASLVRAGFTGVVMVPEDRPDPDGKTRFRGDYTDQVAWEEAGLTVATVILAYVPRNMATMPALTTNVEWGVWQSSGKIVLGLPAGGEKNHYLEHYAHKLGVPTSTTLEQTVWDAVELLDQRQHIEQDCVFCQIVTRDPKHEIEQRLPNSVVITPLNPVVAGHKLIIPYIHVTDARQNPMVTGQVMADAATYAAGVGDCNIITSMGADATQTVFHLHVHIVPRAAGDGLTLPWTGQV